MIVRRACRLFGPFFASALIVVGQALPTFATAKVGHTVGNNPPGEGTIQAAGSITFTSRTSFTYSVDVRDYCGTAGHGDGYGAANRFGLSPV